MIIFKDVLNPNGEKQTLEIPSNQNIVIDASGLIALPALIDPHVHFRVPGSEYKETWVTASQAAINGGITTVFDMPNNQPACVTEKDLNDKIKLINQQLEDGEIPLRYFLYFGADKNYLDEIPKVKGKVIALKIFMGSSTGNMLINDDAALEKAFKLAAESDMTVAVHAEDEDLINQNKLIYQKMSDPSVHSKIRSPEAAEKAVAKAIAVAKKTGARLYILHVSTENELKLIRQAKNQGMPIFAEVTPHHLFLTDKDYVKWGSYVKVNPPLRTEKDLEAMWQGLNDGTIDAIGSDHAPHTTHEKQSSYQEAPSGIPNIDTTLPLLLNAFYEKKISLERIAAVTRNNIEAFFNLPSNEDLVLVDINLTKTIEKNHLKTKCGWSPFEGRTLRGWPVYTILKNKVYNVV